MIISQCIFLVCTAFADNRRDTGPSKGGPAAPPPPPPGSLFQPKGPTAAAPAASTSSSGMSAVFSELSKVQQLSALQAPGSQFGMAYSFSGRFTMLSDKDFVTTWWHCGLEQPGLVCCTSCFNFPEALCKMLCRTTKDQKGCLNHHARQKRIKRGSSQCNSHIWQYMSYWSTDFGILRVNLSHAHAAQAMPLCN